MRVTGTRFPDTPPVASRLVGSDLLAARNSASAAEILARTPGIYVSDPGGRGGVSSLFVRGAEANFTAVLMDGVQVNDPTNSRGGAFDLSLVNVDEIARIEIVNGPLSSVYGSDALGAVLNIVTHEPGGPHAGAVNAELGSRDYVRVGLRAGGPLGRGGGFSASASRAAEGPRADSSSHRTDVLAGRLRLSRSPAQTLQLNLRHAEADARAFPDASGGPEFAVRRLTDTRRARDTSLGVDWTMTHWSDVELTLFGSWFEHIEHHDSPGVAPGVLDGLPPSVVDTSFTRAALAAYARFTGLTRMDAVLGASFRQERGDSVGLIRLEPLQAVPTSYRLERDDAAMYAELSYRPVDALTATAAWRTDFTDESGQQTTGRLSLSYALPRRATRVYATWAQGFKLPSLFALAHPLVGNAALEPEHARSLELGAAFAPSARMTWDLRLFSQRFRGIIDFDYERLQVVNRARMESDGLELSTRYANGQRWTLEAHVTLLDVGARDDGPPLMHRPERLGGIDAIWSSGASTRLFLGWRYVGERFDASVPTGSRVLPAYGRVDVAVEWPGPATTRWRVSLDNVTDRRYSTALGFPAEGRGIRVSWSGQFGSR